MNRKEFAEKRKELLRQINKLAVPVDPNRKQRDKLLEELDRLDQADMNRLETAIKETRRLLKDDIAELKSMCKGTFIGTLPVKAKIKVKIGFTPCTLDTHDSTCVVSIDFPKDRRKLSLFAPNEEEVLSAADIMEGGHAKGLLPELDKHVDRLKKLHAGVIKKIEKEAKRHEVDDELNLFIDEVMN